jgi:hypothetical protein
MEPLERLFRFTGRAIDATVLSLYSHRQGETQCVWVILGDKCRVEMLSKSVDLFDDSHGPTHSKSRDLRVVRVRPLLRHQPSIA